MLERYKVIKDLFSLSEKADEIIQQTRKDTKIDDGFFEDVKAKLLQIVTSDKPQSCKLSVLGQGDGHTISKSKGPERLANTRGHVHVKNKNSDSEGYIYGVCGGGQEAIQQVNLEPTVTATFKSSPGVPEECVGMTKESISESKYDALHFETPKQGKEMAVYFRGGKSMRLKCKNRRFLKVIQDSSDGQIFTSPKKRKKLTDSKYNQASEMPPGNISGAALSYSLERLKQKSNIAQDFDEIPKQSDKSEDKISPKTVEEPTDFEMFPKQDEVKVKSKFGIDAPKPIPAYSGINNVSELSGKKLKSDLRNFELTRNSAEEVDLRTWNVISVESENVGKSCFEEVSIRKNMSKSGQVESQDTMKDFYDGSGQTYNVSLQSRSSVNQAPDVTIFTNRDSNKYNLPVVGKSHDYLSSMNPSNKTYSGKENDEIRQSILGKASFSGKEPMDYIKPIMDYVETLDEVNLPISFSNEKTSSPSTEKSSSRTNSNENYVLKVYDDLSNCRRISNGKINCTTEKRCVLRSAKKLPIIQNLKANQQFHNANKDIVNIRNNKRKRSVSLEAENAKSPECQITKNKTLKKLKTASSNPSNKTYSGKENDEIRQSILEKASFSGKEPMDYIKPIMDYVEETLDEVNLPIGFSNEKKSSLSTKKSSSRTNSNENYVLKVYDDLSNCKRISNEEINCTTEKRYVLRSAKKLPIIQNLKANQQFHNPNKDIVNKRNNKRKRSVSLEAEDAKSSECQITKNKTFKKLKTASKIPSVKKPLEGEKGCFKKSKKNSMVKLFKEKENPFVKINSDQWLREKFSLEVKYPHSSDHKEIARPVKPRCGLTCPAVKNTTALYNRKPLKLKTEEKRKLREIRVQKTKEKREHLEKEREERIRLSEQRLKRRFEQHEEMLREKNEKFKIKCRRRQQGSAVSTSSKNSKEDRTKDNAACCNVANSGQKLSKKGDSNCEVKPKKADLAVIEGTFGSSPEFAAEQNAILVDSKKLSAKCVAFGNTSKIGRIEELSRNRNVKRSKALEESVTVKVPQTSMPLAEVSNFVKMIKGSSTETGSCTRMKAEQFKQVSLQANSVGTKCRTSLLSKKLKILSKNIQFKTAVKQNQCSYLLRFQEKKRDNAPGKSGISNSLKRFEGLSTKNSKLKAIHQSTFSVIKPALERKITFSQEMELKGNIKNSATSIKKTLPTLKNKRNLKLHPSSRFSEDSDKENTKLWTKEAVKPKEVLSDVVSGICNNMDEELGIDSKNRPPWATSVHLKLALIHQHYTAPDVQEIFGDPQDKTVDLVAIFGQNRTSYHQRTSSDEWSINITPT